MNFRNWFWEWEFWIPIFVGMTVGGREGWLLEDES